MTKKIAVINDLSGFGKCSLTAAISVISAMGVQPCPLPTAVLSAQTGYQNYYCDDYIDRMDLIYGKWRQMQVHFDGIYTGFVSGEHQLEKIHEFLDLFREEDTFLLVDPVMGDNGVRYPFFTERIASEMRRLALRADIITPNLTELCLLTGRDYRETVQGLGKEQIVEAARQMAAELMAEGVEQVLVTGIRYREEDGEEMMGNLAVTEGGAVFRAFPFIGESYSGTGDLFASVIAGGRARGEELSESMELAGEMIEEAIGESVRSGVPRNDGVDYETFLWMLSEKNRKR